MSEPDEEDFEQLAFDGLGITPSEVRALIASMRAQLEAARHNAKVLDKEPRGATLDNPENLH